MEALKATLDLFFEKEEEVCVSNTQWAYHSVPQNLLLSGEIPLISPNSKVTTQLVKTKDLTLLSINPIKGFRSDKNVTSCRSFLFELDVGDTLSQLNYTKTLGIPTSIAVFSGSKSVHFGTVLDEPVDIKTYHLMAKWALNIGTLYDKNCKNPSRSIRIPGAIRPETSKEQKLIEIKSRIKVNDFMDWLYKHENSRPKERKKTNNLTNESDYNKLSPWLKKALKENNIDFSKGRNIRWYSIFYDFAKAGYTQEEAEFYLQNYFQEENDFTHKEWLICSKSAYDHVNGKL